MTDTELIAFVLGMPAGMFVWRLYRYIIWQWRGRDVDPLPDREPER